jgi:hypothetical protein
MNSITKWLGMGSGPPLALGGKNIHGIISNHRKTYHMEPATIFLTDPDAADYPFPYQIGDRLKSPAKDIQGTVRKPKELKGIRK